MTLEERIRSIVEPDQLAAKAAEEQWNSVAKPLGSLGWFEGALVKIAALRSSTEISLRHKTLLVFCADHGVVSQGVSQCGSEVTAKVAVALAEGRSSVSALARTAECRIIPVDGGIRNFAGHEGVLKLRPGNGSGDISREPAMSRKDCVRAMELSADLAERLASEGTELLAVGEMGIGNTTAASALTAALLDLPPETVTGHGAGLSQEGLNRKISAIRRALERCKDEREDPVGLMAELGGFEIAAMCGALIGAADCRIPVIIDGYISAVAALCALKLCPCVKAAMLASHVSGEPAGEIILEALGLDAPIHAGMYLGEGSGAVMLMPLLEMARSLYGSGQTFDRLGIDAYRRFD